MKEGTVSDIVEKNFRSGTSKNGKPYVIHKYKSGEVEFTSFQELEIGDQVLLTQNDYGWQGKKPTPQDAQHEELMNAIRKTYDKLLELERKLNDSE